MVGFVWKEREIHKKEVGIYVPQSKRCTGSPKSEVTRPLPIRQVIIRLVNKRCGVLWQTRLTHVFGQNLTRLVTSACINSNPPLKLDMTAFVGCSCSHSHACATTFFLLVRACVRVHVSSLTITMNRLWNFISVRVFRIDFCAYFKMHR